MGYLILIALIIIGWFIAIKIGSFLIGALGFIGLIWFLSMIFEHRDG